MPNKYTWIGTTTAWTLNTNWSPNPPGTQAGPGEGDTAIFDYNAIGPVAGSNQLVVPPPTGLTTSGAASTGGHLAQSSTYKYYVTAINTRGESTISAELSYTTPASGTATNTINLNWTAAPGATGYNIYRTAAGGATGTELFLATVGAVVTYADTSATTPAGALPTTNTANILLALIDYTASMATTVTVGTQGTKLQAQATLIRVGLPSQISGLGTQGSGSINHDFGTLTGGIEVYSTTSSGSVSGVEPVRFVGNSSSTTLSVTGGTVGIGTDTNTDTANIGPIGVESSGTVTIGRGVTYASATNNGGTLMALTAPTTSIKTIAGDTSIYGNAQIPTLYCMGGTTDLNCRNATTPFVDVADLYAWGGTLDLTSDARPTILGNYHRRAGSGFSLKAFSDTQVSISNMLTDFNGQTQISDN